MGATISSSNSHDHEHYREMARKNAAIRRDLSQQSQAAYRARNGAKAKELSLKAKEYGREMDRFNALARDAAFRAHNASRPQHEMDLHGLKVQEAVDITRERLERFIRNKEPNLIIIVGKGNNSVNNVAKIKPAITELVREFHIKATPNKPNQGCIYVEPMPASEPIDLSWIDGFFQGLLRKILSFFG